LVLLGGRGGFPSAPLNIFSEFPGRNFVQNTDLHLIQYLALFISKTGKICIEKEIIKAIITNYQNN